VASALFNSGQYMAVVVFTPIMAWLTHAWAGSMSSCGWGVGLVLATVWFAWYKEPHKDPRLTEEEKPDARGRGAGGSGQ
jgi:ACS family glucarate transporter-like MFS transporter